MSGLISLNNSNVDIKTNVSNADVKTTLDYFDNIFIFSGQSNAVGQAGNSSTLPSSLQGERDMVDIWWEGDYANPVAGHWEPMHPILNTLHPDYTDPNNQYYNTAGWSVEQKMSDLLKDYYNRKIYIIKSAYGAKAISNWDSPNGERWVELYRYVTEATNTDRQKLRAFVWLQWESDAITGSGNLYEGRLRSLISNIRSINNKMTSIPFIIIGVHDSAYPGKYEADKILIKQAFENVSNDTENVYLLNPNIEGVTLADSAHYSAASLIVLGGEIYNLMVENSII